MTRVFVSYTRADRSFASRLAVDLTRAGLNVWYDRWEILPGDSIVDKIDGALRAHDCLLVILSPEALQSQWVRRELSSSLMRHLAGKKVRVTPVMSSQCEMPALISDVRYADFTKSYESGFAELLASFGLTPKVPAYTSRPRPVTELDLVSANGPVKTLFPTTFADWPDCVLGDGNKVDALVIVGSTTREKVGEGDRFAQGSTEVELFGARWSFSRQASPGTVRDLVRVVDLASFLTQAKLLRGGGRSSLALDEPLCTVDICVSRDQLNKNLILVGAADTNLFFGLATIAYRQRFGFSIPTRYSGDDQLYFTCDQIESDLSGRVYSRLEESGHMHSGYIVMVPNPWAPTKVLVMASGIRATGTQAALLALIRGTDDKARRDSGSEPWRRLAGNNRHNAAVPAKIVRATRAAVVEGSDILADADEMPVSPHARISQRHTITDFEFLE